MCRWLKASSLLHHHRSDTLSSSNNRNLILTLDLFDVLGLSWGSRIFLLQCDTLEELHREGGGLLRQSHLNSSGGKSRKPAREFGAVWSLEEMKPRRWLGTDQSDCGVPPSWLSVCCVITALSNQPRLALRDYPHFYTACSAPSTSQEVSLWDELTACNVDAQNVNEVYGNTIRCGEMSLMIS